jgi:DNA-binding CsgD family transcriptional regulator
MLLCDATGRVLIMNKAAEQMIVSGDGFSLADGRLQPARKTDVDALARLIGEVVDMSSGSGPSTSGALAIPRPSGRRDFGLIVAPYHGDMPDAPWVQLAPATRVAVFIADPESQAEPPDETIARLYGLTMAEARLAGRLARGKPLSEISESLGITRETARTRLKVIFSKTDTHRQAELVRLILSGLSGLAHPN